MKHTTAEDEARDAALQSFANMILMLADDLFSGHADEPEVRDIGVRLYLLTQDGKKESE